MREASRPWAEQARYDLDTAGAMLSSGRYLYVVFCCQQAVEKALKALIVVRTGEMPPRLHNLPRLAEDRHRHGRSQAQFLVSLDGLLPSDALT